MTYKKVALWPPMCALAVLLALAPTRPAKAAPPVPSASPALICPIAVDCDEARASVRVAHVLPDTYVTVECAGEKQRKKVSSATGHALDFTFDCPATGDPIEIVVEPATAMWGQVASCQDLSVDA